MLEIKQIIHKIWGNAPVTYEPLDGGFVNFTYKTKVNEDFFVLRINGSQNDFLGLSRFEEVQVMRYASEIGIAPKVLSISTADYLVTEFIDAPTLTRDDIFKPHKVLCVMETLRKLHSIKYDRYFSPFDLVNKQIAGMKSLNVPLPELLEEFLPKLEIIEKRFISDSAYRKAYCHNDFYTFNMLNSSNGLYVIDWELSGIGDIFFDLATISFHNAFTTEQDEHMLKCYFGKIEPEHAIALNDMKFMNMLREATWGLLHSGMKEDTVNHNMDYFSHGMSVLKRLNNGYLCL